MLQNLLKINSIRKKVLFEVKNKYFSELDISLPVGDNFWIQLYENDSYDSFYEIFIKKEYARFLPEINIYNILDIGANFGFFSFWLQSLYPVTKLNSIMVEPSLRCFNAINKQIDKCKFNDHFKSLRAVIGDNSLDNIKFFDRPFMAGSTFSNSFDDYYEFVPILKYDDLLNQTITPFDLIKCDIEGSEWEFINHYEELFKKCKFLLLEWHSWHTGGGGFPQIEKKLHDQGFLTYKTSQPSPAIGRNGEVGLSLFKNKCS